MVEAFGKAFNDKARRGNRSLASLPAINLCHLYGRESLWARRSNFGRSAGNGIQRKLGNIRPGDVPNTRKRQNNDDQSDVAHMLPHFTRSLNDACDQ